MPWGDGGRLKEEEPTACSPHTPRAAACPAHLPRLCISPAARTTLSTPRRPHPTCPMDLPTPPHAFPQALPACTAVPATGAQISPQRRTLPAGPPAASSPPAHYHARARHAARQYILFYMPLKRRCFLFSATHTPHHGVRLHARLPPHAPTTDHRAGASRLFSARRGVHHIAHSPLARSGLYLSPSPPGPLLCGHKRRGMADIQLRTTYNILTAFACDVRDNGCANRAITRRKRRKKEHIGAQ